MQGIVLAIGYLALLLFLMRRCRFFTEAPGLRMRTIALLFLLKVMAGTALWAVYTWGYPDRSMADIFKYFDDSKVMYDALWDRPSDFLRMLTGIGNDSAYFTEKYYLVMNNWVRRFETNVYNDSHTMIRFNAVLRILSFGQYHVHTVFASFLSTAGLVALYRALQPFVRGRERGLMLGVFAWPSLLFWSSGPLKESLLMLGFGFFLLGALRPMSNRPITRGLAALMLGLALMLVVKFYVLLCLIPGLLAWWWTHLRPGRPLLKSALVHVLLVVAALLFGRAFPAYDPLYLLALKQSDFLGMAREVASGSVVAVPLLEPTFLGFIKQIPVAIHLCFISPFEMLGKGPLPLAAALENVFVIGLPLITLLRRQAWPLVDRPTMLFALSFVLLLSLLIGWTVPVVGALVRYRIPLLPFISLFTLLVIDTERLPRWAQLLLRQ